MLALSKETLAAVDKVTIDLSTQIIQLYAGAEALSWEKENTCFTGSQNTALLVLELLRLITRQDFLRVATSVSFEIYLRRDRLEK